MDSSGTDKEQDKINAIKDANDSQISNSQGQSRLVRNEGQGRPTRRTGISPTFTCQKDSCPQTIKKRPLGIVKNCQCLGQRSLGRTNIQSPAKKVTCRTYDTANFGTNAEKDTHTKYTLNEDTNGQGDKI